jgi:hypothetical protein
MVMDGLLTHIVDAYFGVKACSGCRYQEELHQKGSRRAKWTGPVAIVISYENRYIEHSVYDLKSVNISLDECIRDGFQGNQLPQVVSKHSIVH